MDRAQYGQTSARRTINPPNQRLYCTYISFNVYCRYISIHVYCMFKAMAALFSMHALPPALRCPLYQLTAIKDTYDDGARGEDPVHGELLQRDSSSRLFAARVPSTDRLTDW